jgi:hypothetical protein
MIVGLTNLVRQFRLLGDDPNKLNNLESLLFFRQPELKDWLVLAYGC